MIIGLHGKLQAGKDTTFERFQDRCRGLVQVERLSFADPLKDSACALLDITRDQMEAMKVLPHKMIKILLPDPTGPEDVMKTFSMREFLQRYGTESHRDVFGDNFWVDQALAKVTDPNKVYVITDCRFENEASAIYGAGGVVIRVLGPEGNSDTHASEKPLGDEYIYDTIDNSVRNDNFANLDNEIEEILMRLVTVQEVLV